MSINLELQYIKIKDEDYKKAMDIGGQISGNKKSYKTTQNLVSGRKSTHQLGLLANIIRSYATGIPVDYSIKKGGDQGFDFLYGESTFDDKAATFIKSPDLKEFPKNSQTGSYTKTSYAGIYHLIALNEKEQSGAIVGWATHEQVHSAPLKNYGYGPRRCLSWYDFVTLNQTGLHPSLPKQNDFKVSYIDILLK